MQSGTLSSYIDKNATLTFGEHVHVDTAEYFAGLRQATLPLQGNPLPEVKKMVEKLSPVPVVWKAPKNPQIRPHEPMAIIRDGLRVVFNDMKKINGRLKTLVVGAAFREIQNEKQQPNVYFSLHDSEAKDEMRSMIPMQNRICELVELARKTSPELMAREMNFDLDSRQLVDLYAETQGMEGRIGFRLEKSGQKFARLIYEDAFYNKTQEDFYDDFEKTGATHALLIGLLPPELAEEACPTSPLYRFQKTESGKARMTDMRGYANGYVHEMAAWQTMMMRPAYAGKNFNLVSEIVTRFGPFVICTISRTMNGGTITRDITLFPEPYVSVVDLGQLAGREENLSDVVLGKKVDLEKRFLMKEEEYQAVENYTLSLDEKAVTVTAVTAFIRKRQGGAALIDKVFTEKWDCDSRRISSLATVVVLRTSWIRRLNDGAGSGLEVQSVWRQLCGAVLGRLRLPGWLAGLLDTEAGVRALVLRHDPVLEQTVELAERKYAKRFLPMRYNIFGAKAKQPEMMSSEEKTCEFCSEFPHLARDNHDDEQVMVCGRDYAEHKYELTDKQADSFRNELLPNDDDQPGVAAVKAGARKVVPKLGFSCVAKTVFLQGAFGVGKSYQIKKAYVEGDGIIAPFRKLMDDYPDMWFKTLHRAIIDNRSIKTLWVDECSSVPYEFLATIVYLCQPEKVVLVGDFKQSKTLPSEGTCLDRRFDVSGSHYLVKNFRNNSAVIEWARECYGYKLEPSSKTPSGDLYEILPAGADVPEGAEHISPDRALVNIEVTDNTIRAYQGQTCDDLCITLTPESLRTFAVPALKLVGLTRAKGKTYLRLLEGVSKEAVEAIIRKREYVAVNDKMKARNVGAQIGRLVIALERYVREQEIADLVRAFPSQIKRQLVLDGEAELKDADFGDRPGSMEQLRAEVAQEADEEESDSEEEDETTDDETDDSDVDNNAPRDDDSDDDDDDDEEPRGGRAWPRRGREDDESEDDGEWETTDSEGPADDEPRELVPGIVGVSVALPTPTMPALTFGHFEETEWETDSEPEVYNPQADGPVVWSNVAPPCFVAPSEDEEEGEEVEVAVVPVVEQSRPAQMVEPKTLKATFEEVKALTTESVEQITPTSEILADVPVVVGQALGVAAVALPIAATAGTAVALVTGSTAVKKAAVAATVIGYAATAAQWVDDRRRGRSELEVAIRDYESKKPAEVIEEDDEDAQMRKQMAELRRQAEEADNEYWSAAGDPMEQTEEIRREQEMGRQLTPAAARCALRLGLVDWQDVGLSVLELGNDDAEGHIVPKLEDGRFVTRVPVMPVAKADQLGWNEMSERYVAQTLLVEQEVENAVPEIKAPVFRATFDSFREVKEIDPYAANEGRPINNLARMAKGVFTGKFVGDPTETRKNAKGNYKKARTVQKFGVGCNNTYNTDDSLGQVATLAERYCCAKKQFVLDDEGRTLARQMAENAFEELVDREKLAKQWEDTRHAVVYESWLKKAREAGYAAAHEALAEENARTVRYHGKEIVKPKQEMSVDGALKVGQGISAWSKEANSFFGAACRIVTQVEQAVLKDEAVFNNGMTDEEAVKRFMKAAVKLPTFDGVTLDVSQMDSRVNEFVFEVLKQFDLLLGVNREFVELYYSMHCNYQLLSDDVKVVLNWVMTSGAPWTLKGNTNTVAIFECWLFRGEGPWARFWQGDDARRNQAKLRLDADRAERLKLYTNFTMSIIHSQFGDLCGFIFSHGQVVPSIRRKLCKLIGTEFKSLEHFQLYQISLRDWCVKQKASLAFADSMLINAENNGVSVFTVESWFEVLESVGHMSGEQFGAEVVRLRKEFHFVNAAGHLETV